MLAICTPSNKEINIQSQIRPPNPSPQCLHSSTYTKMSCVARIMKLLHQQLMQNPRLQNIKLIYLQFRIPVHQTKAMHILDTKIIIIGHGLFPNSNHICVLLILLALIHSTNPARLYSQHRQPSLMPIHSQLLCSFTTKTPGVGH